MIPLAHLFSHLYKRSLEANTAVRDGGRRGERDLLRGTTAPRVLLLILPRRLLRCLAEGQMMRSGSCLLLPKLRCSWCSPGVLGNQLPEIIGMTPRSANKCEMPNEHRNVLDYKPMSL